MIEDILHARKGSTRTAWQLFRERQPLRKIQRIPQQRRVKLQVRRDELIAGLTTIDRQIHDLTSQRIETLHGLREVRDALWPTYPHRVGRYPPEAETPPMPPAHPDAWELWGRGLRAACRAILRTHGRLPLPDLHALIHHYGYAIHSPTPTKALADAMAYEVERGRVRRVARGVYEIDPDAPRSRWRSDTEPDLIDPALDLDPPAWPGAPGTAAACTHWPATDDHTVDDVRRDPREDRPAPAPQSAPARSDPAMSERQGSGPWTT